MKESLRITEQVDVSSDESSSSNADDHKPEIDQISDKFIIGQGVDKLFTLRYLSLFRHDAIPRRAKMYQEYMQMVPIPTATCSLIPCSSWTGLAASIKASWDQMRIGADNEGDSLDMLIHPTKAEASIWLMEEVQRRTSFPSSIAKLWVADPIYHAYIDAIFPKLQNPSK
ncbi:unnamed protein product [Withania somnifera]